MVEKFSFSNFFNKIPQRHAPIRKEVPHTDSNHLLYFTGFWSDETSELTLSIKRDGSVLFNRHLLDGRFLSISPTHFVFQDHFGYTLQGTLLETHRLLLVDEADEQEYLLQLHYKH